MVKSKIITSQTFQLASNTAGRMKNSNLPELVIKYHEATFPHNQFKTGLNLLSETHRMSGLDNAGVIITGITGVGKSRLLDTYTTNTSSKLCYQPTDVLTPRPILLVKIPPYPTIPRVIEKILLVSEHLIPGARRTHSLERRLHQLITTQNVEMIILDEFQHLLKKNATRQVVNATLNFIKTLVDDYKLAFCLTGLPEMGAVLDGFDEIKDRLSFGEFHMKPFSVDTRIDRQDFSAYINPMLSKLERMDIDCSDLHRKNMDRTLLLMRLHLSTGGKARGISGLFKKALLNLKPGDRLTNKCFEDVCTRNALFNQRSVFNPFSAERNALEKQINVLKVMEKTKEDVNAKAK